MHSTLLMLASAATVFAALAPAAAASDDGSFHQLGEALVIITVLGIGAMGFPMARRLCEAGHVVHVWNRSRDKAERLTPFGGIVHDNPASATSDQSDAIF